MKTVLKIGLLTVSLLIVALLVVPFLIPKQTYIDWAIDIIEDRLPVKLSVLDADLRLLPTPHLSLIQIDIKLLQEDGSYADFLQAASLDMATALDFDIRRLGTLENLESLEIRSAKLLYPPGQKNPKPVVIERLLMDNIDLRPKLFRGDIELDGQYDKLILIGDLAVEVRHDKQDNSREGQVTLRSKSLTLLYSKDVSIRKQPLSLKVDFNYSPERMRLGNGRLQVGPQVVTLTGDRSGDGIQFDFQAHPAQVEFLKTIIPALAVVPGLETADADGQLLIPTTKGKAVHVEGKATAEALKLGAYSLSGVSSDISYESRKLQFSHMQARLLDGTLSGDAALNFIKPQTTYDLNLVVKNVAVERIGNVGDSLSGRAYLNLKAQGKGFDKASLTVFLSGTGDFEIKQLKLKKLKFFRPLMSLQQWTGLSLISGLVNKTAVNKAKNLDEEAQNLTAQFTIGEGAVDFSSIRVNYPDAHVELEGRVGFDESLDFEGTVNMSGGLVSSLFDAVSAKKAATSDKGLTSIPLKVKGTLQDPDVGVDSNFMTGKLAGIAALPVRLVGGILTLPLRLLTPRSHQKGVADETESGATGETGAEEPAPTKTRSIGPAAGGGRRR